MSEARLTSHREIAKQYLSRVQYLKFIRNVRSSYVMALGLNVGIQRANEFLDESNFDEIGDILEVAFTWDETPAEEGASYWYKVYTKAIEKQKEERSLWGL